MANKSSNSIEKDIRESILYLNHQLVTLKQEIAMKMQKNMSNASPTVKKHKNQLEALDQQIEELLSNINTVMKLSDSESIWTSDSLPEHHDEIEKFCSLIMANAEKIADINTHL